MWEGLPGWAQCCAVPPLLSPVGVLLLLGDTSLSEPWSTKQWPPWWICWTMEILLLCTTDLWTDFTITFAKSGLRVVPIELSLGWKAGGSDGFSVPNNLLLSCARIIFSGQSPCFLEA